MAKKPALNLREYWDEVGTENVLKIVADLGTSVAYFRMLRYGIKKPGRERALQIMESARNHTPTCVPDLELLLAGVPRAGKNPATTIEPSPRFLRSQKRHAASAGVPA